MAYEGKYLAETPKAGKASKAPKKKGRIRPWMIVVAVVLILAVFSPFLGKVSLIMLFFGLSGTSSRQMTRLTKDYTRIYRFQTQ